MSEFSFLKNTAVHIYITKSEKYGVRDFSKEVQKYISNNCENVSVLIIRVNLFSLIKNIINDRINNRWSICCLWLGVFSWINYKKSIYIIHGYPNRSDYNLVRYIFILNITKLACIFNNLIVANSLLTYCILIKFFRIKPDFHWNNIKNNNIKIRYKSTKKRNKNIVYIGRIIEAKGIISLLNFFEKNPDICNGWSLVLVGERPCMKNIYNSKNILFLGYRNELYINKILSESFCLFSGNILEPYGMVFEKAVENQNIIVTYGLSGALIELNKHRIVKIESLNDLGFKKMFLELNKLWNSK